MTRPAWAHPRGADREKITLVASGSGSRLSGHCRVPPQCRREVKRSNTNAAPPQADAQRSSRAPSIDTASTAGTRAVCSSAACSGRVSIGPAALRLPPRTMRAGPLRLTSVPIPVPISAAASLMMRLHATSPDSALLTRLGRPSILRPALRALWARLTLRAAWLLAPRFEDSLDPRALRSREMKAQPRRVGLPGPSQQSSPRVRARRVAASRQGA